MARAGVAELKATLSRYLARVKAGEEVVVTDRGKPVVWLLPYRASSPDEESTADLVRAGVLRAPRAALSEAFFRRRRVPDPKAAIRKAISEQRRSSR